MGRRYPWPLPNCRSLRFVSNSKNPNSHEKLSTSTSRLPWIQRKSWNQITRNYFCCAAIKGRQGAQHVCIGCWRQLLGQRITRSQASTRRKNGKWNVAQVLQRYIKGSFKNLATMKKWHILILFFDIFMTFKHLWKNDFCGWMFLLRFLRVLSWQKFL